MTSYVIIIMRTKYTITFVENTKEQTGSHRCILCSFINTSARKTINNFLKASYPLRCELEFCKDEKVFVKE